MKKLCIGLTILVLFLEVTILMGCAYLQNAGEYENDVTNKTKAGSGFANTALYKTKVALYLRDKKRTKSSWVAAIQIYSRPKYDLEYEIVDEYPSLEQYRRNPQKWPDILGVLDAGTQMQCTKILEQGTLLWDGSLYYFATIKNGPYKGVEVEISDLCVIDSIYEKKVTMKPNPEVLVANK